ncbi:MAG TPA: MBL fold metallo-hydrolase, partial [Chloroflexota bacterium]|nr:MBL fold metallo-hydrolase [Chloroflexota bacterium]
MQEARTVLPDIHILPSFLPAPGIGNIPVNAFVLKSEQPVLVDTGMHQDHAQFMAELESVIDPSDLRWIWLTHPDQDHLGSLQALVNANPRLRVITTFLGFAILGLRDPLPPDRVYLLNPGEQIDVGDRTLVCLRPPTFDNPATTAMYDTRSHALFSSDCFGAALPMVAEE